MVLSSRFVHNSILLLIQDSKWLNHYSLPTPFYLNNMDSLFSKVNWGAGIGIVALEAIVLIRWLLKKKNVKEKKTA